MQAKPSTFGHVLTWVRERLQQVERNMSINTPSDRSTAKCVSQARSAIDSLISEDAKLESEYIKAAEAEYQALVDLIQQRNIPITDDLEDLAKKIRKG